MADEAQDSANFLSRWSRRKRSRARQDGAAAPTETAVADDDGGGQPVALMPESAGDMTRSQADPDLSAEALPDPETLTLDSDFTVYLRENVPAPLRQAALRRLWRLDPVFANLDGLNEYDLDYRAIHAAVKNVISSYQVGKGMPGRAVAADEKNSVEPDRESDAVDPSPAKEPTDAARQQEEQDPSPATDPAGPQDLSDEVEPDGALSAEIDTTRTHGTGSMPRRRTALATRRGLPGGE